MDKKAHLQDTIKQLEILRKKQNAEIDELIVSLRTQATIDTERAGTTTEPAIPVLKVTDKVTILNTGKYWCDTGTISKINKRTNVASIVLASGQTTTRLLKNLELIKKEE
jgi:hypothetical protein